MSGGVGVLGVVDPVGFLELDTEYIGENQNQRSRQFISRNIFQQKDTAPRQSRRFLAPVLSIGKEDREWTRVRLLVSVKTRRPPEDSSRGVVEGPGNLEDDRRSPGRTEDTRG